MGMIAFDRDSGVEVFPADALASFSSVKSAAALDEALASYLRCLGLTYNVLDLRFDPSTGIVHLGGIVEHHEHRERIALCCGNVRGVGGVDDAMNVIMPSEVSRWRFVQPGDTFESIAKDAYRDPTRANALRAANQPLIGDSDVLPAGWLLRIPAVEHLSRD